MPPPPHPWTTNQTVGKSRDFQLPNSRRICLHGPGITAASCLVPCSLVCVPHGTRGTVNAGTDQGPLPLVAPSHSGGHRVIRGPGVPLCSPTVSLPQLFHSSTDTLCLSLSGSTGACSQDSPLRPLTSHCLLPLLYIPQTDSVSKDDTPGVWKALNENTSSLLASALGVNDSVSVCISVLPGVNGMGQY